MYNLLSKFFIFFILFQSITFAQENTNIPPDLQKKLNEYNELLTKYQAEENKNEIAAFLNKSAFIYWETKNYQQALEYFQKSLSINETIGNKNAIYSIHTNLGMIYSDIKAFDKSENEMQTALIVARKTEISQNIISALINLSLILQDQSKFNQAISHLNEAVNYASGINNVKFLRTSYGMLSECYGSLGNAEKSLEYFNLYSSFEKHIQKKEIEKKEKETKKKIDVMQNITNKAVIEKKEKEKELLITTDSLEKAEEINKQKQIEIELKETKLKEKEAQLKSERYLRYSIFFGLLLSLSIAFVIYRNYKQKQAANILLAKQNKEIKAKSKNIQRSINYAQRIQEAMLPDINVLQKNIPESFILFKPRDLVSGDFYWFIDPYKVHLNIDQTSENKSTISKFTAKLKNNYFIIAAVDCTGHGVPGAFMSMIGMNLLYEIVSHGTVEADKILNELHEGIRTSLKQDKTDNQDGMDITLCVIKKKEKVVEFAGAKNPIVYIANNELNRIRGDKFPVGGQIYDKKRIFTKNVIKIETPTTFYLFSDGFQDQFGGPTQTKFLSKKFYNLLLKISNENITKQKEILNRTIDEWKDNKNQTDDILVMGFKLS